MNISDIIGPIMIGPSSSHTAGAARLGNLARNVFGNPIKSAQIYLHGSFAETYKGHGTDLALVAGLLGYAPSDERIPQAFEYAKEKNLDFQFHTIDLGKHTHPNTVKFILEGVENQTSEIIGSSLGGGMVTISSIDGFTVNFTGQYPVLIVKHEDRPGVISKVTSILAEQEINIAQMRVFRQNKGGEALMVLEIDYPVNQATMSLIEKVLYVQEIRSIKNT